MRSQTPPPERPFTPHPQVGGRYTGKCSGGPNHGKFMTHWMKRREYYSPRLTVSEAIVTSPSNFNARVIGWYDWVGEGTWMWVHQPP